MRCAMKIYGKIAWRSALWFLAGSLWLDCAPFVLAQNPQPTKFFDPISNKEVAFTSTLSSYVSSSQLQVLSGTAALNIATQVVSARGA